MAKILGIDDGRVIGAGVYNDGDDVRFVVECAPDHPLTLGLKKARQDDLTTFEHGGKSYSDATKTHAFCVDGEPVGDDDDE
jgi:hypothetical protein